MNQLSLVTDATAPNSAVDAVAEQRQLEMGDRINGRYRVLAHLGSGGMGEVYEVEHVALGRRFAAKVLKRELSVQPALVARFGSEVRAMARIRSDHVAHIVDTGNLDNGAPYFVMELLEGADLKTLLKRTEKLSPRRAARLVIDACWGLHAVHVAGLVHRDIKPSNLFVAVTDSGAERCILLDFGVTKSTSTALTRTGQLVGTPQYMAPEQVDDGTVDYRTDLYSLGAVLYECLVGRTPHQGETLARLVSSILNQDPVPVQRLCPEISEELSNVVATAMARHRQGRFASARALAEALRRYVNSNGTVDSVTGDSTAASLWTPIVTERSTRMRRIRNASLMLLATLVTAGAALLAWTLLRPGAAPMSNLGSSAVFDQPRGVSRSSSATSLDAVAGTPAPSGSAPSGTTDSVDVARIDAREVKPSSFSQRRTRRQTHATARATSPVSAIDATNPYAN